MDTNWQRHKGDFRQCAAKDAQLSSDKDFIQNGGYSVANLLPASGWWRYLLNKVCFADIISTSYLNARLRYYHFRFRKANSHHVGIQLPVSLLTFSSSSACDSASVFRISSGSNSRRRSFDTKATFKMASQIHFRFHIQWSRSFTKLNVYLQTKFPLGNNSVHGWDTNVTSGSETHTPAILKVYFRVRFSRATRDLSQNGVHS